MSSSNSAGSPRRRSKRLINRLPTIDRAHLVRRIDHRDAGHAVGGMLARGEGGGGARVVKRQATITGTGPTATETGTGDGTQTGSAVSTTSVGETSGSG